MVTFSNVLELYKAAREREDGQTMVEYAMVLGMIAVVTVATFLALSGGISDALHQTVAIF